MKDTPTRVFGLMCVLVAVWTATYWLYEPAAPPVSYDQAGADSRRDPAAPAPGAGAQGPMVELAPPVTPVSRPSETRRDPPPAKPAAGDAPKTRVLAPEFWEYTVQPNDTMDSIARKLFGDGQLWHKIAEANPFVDAQKLIPGGTKLKIPKDLANIQGKEVAVAPKPPQDAKPARPAPARQPDPKPAPAAPAAKDQEYTVKSGDTLSGIAKSFYGKSSLWQRIYDANKDVIDDPDSLKQGIKLRIPPQE